jgi:N-acylglucosamine 2-epimerase
MLTVSAAPILRPLLGDQRARPVIDRSLERILDWFADDERGVHREVIHRDGRPVEGPLGQTLNPGHALESMWFVIEEGLTRDDRAIVNRAIEIVRWTLATGWDATHQGLFAFTGLEGGKPPGWEGPNAFGENWDTKIWWVQAEAMYTLALAAREADDDELWSSFETLADYAQRCFADPTYGEWLKYLDRDGTPRVADKGTWIKSMFHTPRALLKLANLS